MPTFWLFHSRVVNRQTEIKLAFKLANDICTGSRETGSRESDRVRFLRHKWDENTRGRRKQKE